MALIYISSQICTVNEHWARLNVYKTGQEVICCDLEDIVSEWCHEDYVIRVVNFCDYICWAATYDNSIIGSGSFHHCGGVIKEGIQAVLSAHRSNGVYSSVLEFLIDWADPLDIENDCQQTIGMQKLWQRMISRACYT